MAINGIGSKNVLKRLLPNSHLDTGDAFEQLIPREVIWQPCQKLGTMNKIHLEESVLT
ncbi:hypothetical protein J6590_004469 [Homalodisca vitripennis]|nr:hypothetical protein J6590_004469 [Homalodisca vitripennis]